MSSSTRALNNDSTDTLINECLAVAGMFNGRVFGGYVRDVIVPRLNGEKCRDDFEGVDIWFRKQEDADAFVKSMKEDRVDGLSIFEICGVSFTSSRELRGVSRVRYNLTLHRASRARFNVFVHHRLPVDDFDVNQLTYKFSRIKCLAESFGTSSVATLIEAIHNKTATMLPEYKEKLIRPNIAHLHVERVNNRYIKRGWKVLCTAPKEIPMDFTETWVHENLVGGPALLRNLIDEFGLQNDPTFDEEIPKDFIETWVHKDLDGGPALLRNLIDEIGLRTNSTSNEETVFAKGVKTLQVPVKSTVSQKSKRKVTPSSRTTPRSGAVPENEPVTLLNVISEALGAYPSMHKESLNLEDLRAINQNPLSPNMSGGVDRFVPRGCSGVPRGCSGVASRDPPRNEAVPKNKPDNQVAVEKYDEQITRAMLLMMSEVLGADLPTHKECLNVNDANKFISSKTPGSIGPKPSRSVGDILPEFDFIPRRGASSMLRPVNQVKIKSVAESTPISMINPVPKEVPRDFSPNPYRTYVSSKETATKRSLSSKVNEKKVEDKSREEAMEAFNIGLDSMRMAFMKVLNSK